jgi:hypothetical protein
MIEMTRTEFMNLLPISPTSNRVPGRRYGLKGGLHEAQFDGAVPGAEVVFILVNKDGWGMMEEALIVKDKRQGNGYTIINDHSIQVLQVEE